MKTVFLLALCAISIVSCEKFHDIPSGNIPCRILQLRQGIFDEDSFAIAYNHKGNPISITRAIVGTSRPNFHFLYDYKGRMTDFYGVYTPPNPYFDVWHRYHYSGLGRIISDTTYEFGIAGPDRPLPDESGRLRVRNISTYAYDVMGRITKSTDTYGFDELTTRVYTYNTQGNLYKIFRQKGADTLTRFFHYDDKVNLRVLHPIWQFLDRDYSLNNSATASVFNSYGLPKVYDFSGHTLGTFATIPLNNVVVKYSCQ